MDENSGFHDEEIVLFSAPGCSLADEALAHPEYTRVFYNVTKEDGVSNVTLSFDHGQSLYILSNRRYQDMKKYFCIKGRSACSKMAAASCSISKSSMEDAATPKKLKQNNLLFFFKKAA